MMALNIWHSLVLIITIMMFSGGIYFIIKKAPEKLRIPMGISVTLVTLLIGTLFFFVVDKYTKEVTLYKLKSKRLLSIEKIVYTGIVKNTGVHNIGKVTFELKLLNKGRGADNIKPGAFYETSSFFDFFGGGAGVLYKPQTIVKKFIVAKDLEPGKAKSFRVYFTWPAYFQNVAEYPKVYGH